MSYTDGNWAHTIPNCNLTLTFDFSVFVFFKLILVSNLWNRYRWYRGIDKPYCEVVSASNTELLYPLECSIFRLPDLVIVIWANYSPRENLDKDGQSSLA